MKTSVQLEAKKQISHDVKYLFKVKMQLKIVLDGERADN